MPCVFNLAASPYRNILSVLFSLVIFVAQKKMLLRKNKKNVICVIFCTLLGDSAHIYSSNAAINLPLDQNGQRTFTYFSTNLITYFIQNF